jgi:hypothetical protein
LEFNSDGKDMELRLDFAMLQLTNLLLLQMTFMDNVLQYMSAGLIFMWTHKSTQADVVRMMYSLGK